MRGEINSEVMKVQDAQYLMNLWQVFHLDDEKYKLMETFNHSPSQFNFQTLLDELPVSLQSSFTDPSSSSPPPDSSSSPPSSSS